MSTACGQKKDLFYFFIIILQRVSNFRIPPLDEESSLRLGANLLAEAALLAAACAAAAAEVRRRAAAEAEKEREERGRAESAAERLRNLGAEVARAKEDMDKVRLVLEQCK